MKIHIPSLKLWKIEDYIPSVSNLEKHIYLHYLHSFFKPLKQRTYTFVETIDKITHPQNFRKGKIMYLCSLRPLKREMLLAVE